MDIEIKSILISAICVIGVWFAIIFRLISFLKVRFHETPNLDTLQGISRSRILVVIVDNSDRGKKVQRFVWFLQGLREVY